jgi:hypothetical protein
MLNWLAGRFSPAQQGGGALVSRKAVGTLIARLDAEAPEPAVKALGNQIENLSRKVLATPNGCRALKQLDEFAQQPVTELWDALLADSRGQSVSETAWSTLTHYYRVVQMGYRHCLENYSASETISKRDLADATIIACRAMMALARSMLLLRTRYCNPTPEIWSQIHNLVDWVERRGNANAQVLPYPGTVLDTTVERELLTALLIQVAPTGSLLPGQIYALERLLRIYVSYYRFSDSYDEQARPFAYEPASNTAPQRWIDGMKERPGFRYFGPGGAYVELCHARDQAHATRGLPEWLGAVHCSSEEYRELLDRLVKQWSTQPPRRRERRDACDGEILVAHDWGDIRLLVRFSELARSGRSFSYDTANVYRINSTLQANSSDTLRDPRSDEAVNTGAALANLISFEESLDHQASERWTLNDTSGAGLGATADSIPAWVRVGMVVAFRHADGVDWQFAMVRRMNCAEGGRLTVGMTRIRGAARSARLRVSAGPTDRRASGADPAIVYDALMLDEGVSSLLLPIGAFDQSWKYALSCGDQKSVVKMQKPLERGLNFERVEVAPVEAARAA